MVPVSEYAAKLMSLNSVNFDFNECSFINHLLDPNLIITENFKISEIFAPIGLILIDNQQYFDLIFIGKRFFRALAHAHILVQLRQICIHDATRCIQYRTGY